MRVVRTSIVPNVCWGERFSVELTHLGETNQACVPTRGEMVVQKKTILRLWRDIKFPASFSNARYFTQSLKKNRGLETTVKTVRNILETDPGYQTSRALKRNFLRRHEYVYFFSQRWEGDLGDMGSDRIKDLNTGEEKGRHFILFVDIFSRKFFCRAVPSKTAEDAANAAEDVFDSLHPPYEVPQEIELDRGPEFAGQFKKLLKQRGARQVDAYGTHKARNAERGIRSFKKMAVVFLETNPTIGWKEAVIEVQDALNRRKNRDIGMSPDDVPEHWMKLQKLYLAKDPIMSMQQFENYYARQKAGNVRVKHRKRAFYIGKLVYIPLKSALLQKESDRQFSYQIFTIAAVLNEKKPPMYRLKDGLGINRKRLYYSEELRNAQPQDTYPIERILGKKKVRGVPMVHIQWLDHDSRFNQWLPESSILRNE